MNSNRRVIINNVVANWLGLAINMAVAFVMSPFLVHSLGDTMYGLWVLLLAVTGYMGLLDAGLKVSVVKYVSRYNALSDTAAISRVVSTVLVLHGAIGLVVIALAAVAAPFVSRLISVPPDAVELAQIVLMITAFNLAITMVSSVFNGILAGLQRYDYLNMIGVAVVVLRSALIVLLVSGGHGILALGLVHTIGQVVSGVLVMVVAFRALHGLEVRLSLVNPETIKTLYGFGSFVLLNNIAMFFLFNTGEILIGVFLSAAAVTYYAIAGNLLQYLSQLIGVMTVLHPYASDREARGDARGLQRTVVLGTKACLMIALPATVTFILVGRPFIALWMGPAYADAAAPLIIVLGVGRLFWLSQSSAGNVLLGAGRHKVLTVTNLATGAAGLCLGALLIREMGLLGLALGMTIPMIITQGLILPRITMKAFSVPGMELLSEGYLRPALATLPYALALAGLMRVIKPDTFFELAAALLTASVALALGMYFVCLSASQRRVLREVFVKWLPAPAPESVG